MAQKAENMTEISFKGHDSVAEISRLDWNSNTVSTAVKHNSYPERKPRV